jgi:hypothetical protein
MYGIYAIAGLFILSKVLQASSPKVSFSQSFTISLMPSTVA